MKTTRIPIGTPDAPITPSLLVEVSRGFQTRLGLIIFMLMLQFAGRAQTAGERIWTTPPFGAFYSLQLGGTNFPPLPFLPFDPIEVPTYVLDPAERTYIYDDSEIDYEELNTQFNTMNPPPPPGEGGGGGTNGVNEIAYNYGTNDLWLEILSVTNDFAHLALHGTQQGYYYQLQNTLELLPQTKWLQGEMLQNTNGTNLIFFSPFPTMGLDKTFFRAAQYVTIVSIEIDPGFPEGTEPTSTNSAGTKGAFRITLSDPVAWNLPVEYRISGTASNGMDYTNISAVVTVPATETSAQVSINPKYDGLMEGDESVRLTLRMTNGYRVDPEKSSAMLFIDDSTNVTFEIVATNLTNPSGIGYHQLSNAIIVSVEGFTTNNFKFVRIDTNGTPGFVANWSGVLHEFGGESKLAILNTDGSFTNSAGFTNGDLFFGTGEEHLIGYLSPDSMVSNLAWVSLTNQTGGNLFRGGLHFDDSGSFGGDLIVVSGGETSSDSNTVWRVQSNRTNTVLAEIATAHLEGVVTLTNDLPKWGPWAGKVITGDEILAKIFAVDSTGAVERFDLQIRPEDFDVIPDDHDLYACDPAGGAPDLGLVVKLNRSLFTNYIGDLVITQAGEVGTDAGSIFIVHWDGDNFVITRVPYTLVGAPRGLEHVTFAPINLPRLTP